MSREIQTEGLITIKENNELVAVVYKDLKSRHNVFYRCEEMSFDELSDLLKLK